MPKLLDISNKKQPSIKKPPDKPKETLETIPKPPITTPKGISFAKLRRYRAKGYTYKDIALKVGCSKVNVINRLHGVIFTPEELEHMKLNLGDILLNDAMKYRSYITPAKLKKADAGTLAKMVSFKHSEYRIEAGLSTSNIAYVDLTKSYEDAKKAFLDAGGTEEEIEDAEVVEE